MNTLRVADALLSSGQTEEGLAKLDALRRQGDDNTLYGASQLYQQYGFLDEAEKGYEILIKRYPDDSGLLLELSDLLIDKSEENRAIDYLSRIHPLDENYLSAQVTLADLYQLEGLDEVAENKLLGALKMAPNEPVLKYALGEFYLSTGQAVKAVDYFQEVLGSVQLEDQNVELKLAEALSLCGEFEQALKMYRKGLKKEKTLDGLFGYAVTAVRIEHDKTAIKALEELKDLDPGYSTLYPVLADAYEAEGNLDQALKTVETGLAEDEYNDRLYAKAAELAVAIHDTDRAEKYYRIVVDRDPDNVDALTKLVELKAQDEDYEGILELLDSRETSDPMLVWFKATAYNQTDQLEKAGACYESCQSSFSDNPEFLQEYGQFLRDIGNIKKCMVIMERAAALNPDNQDLINYLDRLKEDYPD